MNCWKPHEPEQRMRDSPLSRLTPALYFRKNYGIELLAIVHGARDLRRVLIDRLSGGR